MQCFPSPAVKNQDNHKISKSKRQPRHHKTFHFTNTLNHSDCCRRCLLFLTLTHRNDLARCHEPRREKRKNEKKEKKRQKTTKRTEVSNTSFVYTHNSTTQQYLVYYYHTNKQTKTPARTPQKLARGNQKPICSPTPRTLTKHKTAIDTYIHTYILTKTITKNSEKKTKRQQTPRPQQLSIAGTFKQTKTNSTRYCCTSPSTQRS